MTETGRVLPRQEPSARLWILLSFHACLFLVLGGVSLLFASEQTVPWIADGQLCGWLLFVMVLMLFSSTW